MWLKICNAFKTIFWLADTTAYGVTMGFVIKKKTAEMFSTSEHEEPELEHICGVSREGHVKEFDLSGAYAFGSE